MTRKILREEQISEIKQRINEGETPKDLAVEFNAMYLTVYNISIEKTWSYILPKIECLPPEKVVIDVFKKEELHPMLRGWGFCPYEKQKKQGRGMPSESQPSCDL